MRPHRVYVTVAIEVTGSSTSNLIVGLKEFTKEVESPTARSSSCSKPLNVSKYCSLVQGCGLFRSGVKPHRDCCWLCAHKRDVYLLFGSSIKYCSGLFFEAGKLIVGSVPCFSSRGKRQVGNITYITTFIITTISRSPLGTSDPCFVNCELLVDQVIPEHNIGCVVHLKHRINWHNVRNAVRSLSWRTIFLSADPIGALNSAVSEDVSRFVPTMVVRSRSGDKHWFDSNCRRAYDAKQTAYRA